MREVVNAAGIFFTYALLAIFAQNAVFTRALGVSRLVQLVGDDRTNSWLFGLMLCITQVLVAPVSWFAAGWLKQLPYRAMLRPIVYVSCIAVVCLAEWLVLKAGKKIPRQGQLLRILPLAALNSCVLGTVLVSRTQSFTLGQTLGFGLGSGMGYLFAVLMVTEAQRRLRSETIPSAFRGLPITLIYIGVLALAIYGFTGHSVIL
ncbi:MAG: electron transport complex protein RnfA [Faecalibacterium sp.]